MTSLAAHSLACTGAQQNYRNRSVIMSEKTMKIGIFLAILFLLFLSYAGLIYSTEQAVGLLQIDSWSFVVDTAESIRVDIEMQVGQTPGLIYVSIPRNH
jgi:hypothetical protein